MRQDRRSILRFAIGALAAAAGLDARPTAGHGDGKASVAQSSFLGQDGGDGPPGTSGWICRVHLYVATRGGDSAFREAGDGSHDSGVACAGPPHGRMPTPGGTGAGHAQQLSLWREGRADELPVRAREGFAALRRTQTPAHRKVWRPFCRHALFQPVRRRGAAPRTDDAGRHPSRARTPRTCAART